MIKDIRNHAKGIIARPITMYPIDFIAVVTSSVFPGAQRSLAPAHTMYITAMVPTNANIQYCISFAIEM